LPKRDFESLLLEAVDEGLSSLGESSKQAIYYHLEKSFNIKKQEIPTNVKVFARALGKIFGPGADFIETLIVTRLDEKVEASAEWRLSKELKLAEYVDKARMSFFSDHKFEPVEIQVSQCEQPEMES
jgi:nitrogenase molybdenum-iron protein alpha/beta subunit